jgi:uncharacterized protein
MADRLTISGHVGSPSTTPAQRLLPFRGGLVLLAGMLLVAAFKLVDYTAELLWFRALGYEEVFWRLRLAKTAMFAAGFIPAFLYVLINLLVLARLVGLQDILFGGSSATTSHGWRGQSGAAVAWLPVRRLTSLLVLVSAATAAIFGFVFYGEWDRLLRLAWSQDFGMSDPIFRRDIGFYLFVLPFLRLVQTSLMMLALSGTFLLGLAYHRTGGLRLGVTTARAADPRALRHFIMNAILLLCVWAWHYYLARFGLLTRSAGAVYGAGYTDVHIVLISLWVALGATLALAGALFWVAVANAPRLALLGTGAYLLILLAALVIIPGAFQRLAVAPNELELETPFLRHNIELTRTAYGLDKVEVRFHTAEEKLGPGQLRENQATIDNIRLWTIVR